LPGVKLSEIQKQILTLPEEFERLSNEQYNAYKMNLFIKFKEGIERKDDFADMSSMMWGKYSDIHLLQKFVTRPSEISKNSMKDFIAKYFSENNLVVAITKGLPR
jgi:hypothetical protein